MFSSSLSVTTVSSEHTLLRRASNEERRKRTDRRRLCHILVKVGPQVAFPYNNYWLISLVSGKRGFRSKKFKITCYLLLHHPKGPLCAFDRRMINSQKTTSAMTPVLYGRGSFQFSLVCKIKRTPGGTSILGGWGWPQNVPLTSVSNFASKIIDVKYPKFCPLNFRYDPKIRVFFLLIR